MGKNVESYRIALESEINRWKDFAMTLRKDDREACEELKDSCRNHAIAASIATNPIIFESMIISMLAEQKRIKHLEKKLELNQHACLIRSNTKSPN